MKMQSYGFGSRHVSGAAVSLALVTAFAFLTSGCTTIQSPDGSETTVRSDGSVVVRGPRPEPSAPKPPPAASPTDAARTRELADTISRQEQQIKANAAVLAEQTDKSRQVAADLQALEARIEQGWADSQKLAANAEQSRQATGDAAAELEKVVAAKASATKDLASLAEECQKAREQLASLAKAVAECRQQLAALDQKRCDSDAAVAAAKAELARLSENIRLAAKKRDELTSFISAEEHRLADLGRQIEAAQIAATAGPVTQPAAPPTTQQASVAPPEPPGSESQDTPISLVPWVIGAVMVMFTGVLGIAGYARRRAKLFTFTLMDEGSKASHRLQVIAGDHVELGVVQPLRKPDSRNAGSTYLAVDHKGRLALHGMSGSAVKLNDRPINTADVVPVTAGDIIEVNGNGATKRLLVGPVAAANQGAKLSAKSMAASVRPG